MLLQRELKFGLQLFMAFGLAFSGMQMFRIWVWPQSVFARNPATLPAVQPVSEHPGQILRADRI